ncbi:MAG: hypothetical protein Salg2KO_14230 [Salibacteraceae bacterium]
MKQTISHVEIDVQPEGGAVYAKKGKNKTNEQHQAEIQPTFSAYPNPFNQSLTFDTGNRPGQIYVYDIRGVLITQTVVGEQQAQIQGNRMSPGVYIAVFEGVDKSRASIKIIKQ